MREWPRVCGNCGYWNVITTLSVVGPGGKYYGGKYKGLCSKDEDLRKTKENDDCFNDCYGFIGGIKKADYRHSVLKCQDCRYWGGSVLGWLVSHVDDNGCKQKRMIMGADLGECERLQRETICSDGCKKAEHKILTQ